MKLNFVVNANEHSIIFSYQQITQVVVNFKVKLSLYYNKEDLWT